MKKQICIIRPLLRCLHDCHIPVRIRSSVFMLILPAIIFCPPVCVQIFCPWPWRGKITSCVKCACCFSPTSQKCSPAPASKHSSGKKTKTRHKSAWSCPDLCCFAVDHRMVATLLFLSHICILHDRPFLMLSMLLHLNCWKRIRFSVSASSSFVSFSLPDVDAEKMCLEPESVSLMETLITSQHCQGDLQNGFSPPSRVEAHSDTANDQQTREGSEKATSRLVCPVGSHKAALLYPSSLSSRWLNFDVKSLYRPCRNVTD